MKNKPFMIDYEACQGSLSICVTLKWSLKLDSLFKIYLLMSTLALGYCVQALSRYSKQGLLFIVGHSLLIAVVSPAAEHRL